MDFFKTRTIAIETRPVNCANPSNFGQKTSSSLNENDYILISTALMWEKYNPESAYNPILNNDHKITRQEALQKAHDIYEELANKGNTEAKYKLGMMLNENPDANPEIAFRYVREAAEDGHALAINQMGLMYYHGRGIEKNDVFAFDCFNELADQIPNARFNLGFMYFEGRVVEKNVNRAFTLFIDSAEHDSKSALMAGIMNYHGLGIPTNFSTAFLYCNQAANMGNADALYYLGCMYLHGKGVVQDLPAALMYLEKAALRNQFAALLLAEIYEQGKHGASPDAAQAMSYFKQAAGQGNQDALIHLGYQYKEGIGVKKNLALAADFFIRAARLGNKTVTDILRQIGSAFLYNNDFNRAFICLKQASSLDDKQATYHVALMYKYGRGVKKDKSKHLKYLKKAHKLGNADAKYDLAMLLSNDTRSDLLTEAAELNHAGAHYELGKRYYELNSHSVLIEVPEFYFRAIHHFEAAVSNAEEDIPEAHKALVQLYLNGVRQNGDVNDMINGRKAIHHLASAARTGGIKPHSAYQKIAEIYGQGIGGVRKNEEQKQAFLNLANKIDERDQEDAADNDIPLTNRFRQFENL